MLLCSELKYFALAKLDELKHCAQNEEFGAMFYRTGSNSTIIMKVLLYKRNNELMQFLRA